MRLLVPIQFVDLSKNIRIVRRIVPIIEVSVTQQEQELRLLSKCLLQRRRIGLFIRLKNGRLSMKSNAVALLLSGVPISIVCQTAAWYKDPLLVS